MIEIQRSLYKRVEGILSGYEAVDAHIGGVLESNSRGRVWVDDPDNPSTAIIWAIGSSYFMVGRPDNETVNPTLREFIHGTLGPASLEACGGTHFAASLFNRQWLPVMESILAQDHPYIASTQTFRFNPEKTMKALGEQPSASSGSIVPITPELIRSDGTDTLLNDILGDFYDSVDAFMAVGRGWAMMEGDTPLGACFSGYVSGNKHEIVIRTYDEGRRNKGIGTAVAMRFVSQCLEESLLPCWTTQSHNPASIALAQKVGFELGNEYPWFCFRYACAE